MAVLIPPVTRPDAPHLDIPDASGTAPWQTGGAITTFGAW
jgi:hypothetical protein